MGTYATKLLTRDGITMTIDEWCKTEEGIKKRWYPQLLYQRSKTGMSDEKVLSFKRMTYSECNKSRSYEGRKRRKNRDTPHVTPPDYNQRDDLADFRVKLRAFAWNWQHLLACLLCSVLLSSCAGLPGLSDVWREGTPLDYTRLFEIAWRLADSEDSENNWKGLERAGFNIDTLRIYYEASKLTLKAAKCLLEKVTSRDLRVTAIVREY